MAEAAWANVGCDASPHHSCRPQSDMPVDSSFLCPQALSPAGRCRTLDAAADGYGRGEGVAVAALRPLGSAATTQQVLVAGSAVNQARAHTVTEDHLCTLGKNPGHTITVTHSLLHARLLHSWLHQQSHRSSRPDPKTWPCTRHESVVHGLTVEPSLTLLASRCRTAGPVP